MMGWGAGMTPLSIKLSHHYRILDVPGGRKHHLGNVPRGAGIVLWMGYLLWVLLGASGSFFLKLSATGATIVFLCGYWDDIRPLNPIVRLVLHIFAAFLVLIPIELPWTHRILMLLWIAGTTSAYNIIDGLNGLCLSMFIVATLMASRLSAPSFWLPIGSAALGVLHWNFPRARTFLGDGGSTLLGYLFASQLTFSIYTNYVGNTPQLFSIWKLIIFLLLWGGVPVLDTVASIIRRLCHRCSPFLPDRGHLHYRLIDKGFSPVQTLGILVLLHGALLELGLYFFTRFIQ
jgi:UDP-GlcNAc:undecaprenyl-phosphate GlcNAc-1-phosphate transferase